MQVRASQQLFHSCSLYPSVIEIELSNRFPKEGRFSRLGLNHGQLDARQRKFQRDRRGAAAGTDVHQGSGPCRNMPRGQQGFQQQPVDGFVWIGERRQVDFEIPASE